MNGALIPAIAALGGGGLLLGGIAAYEYRSELRMRRSRATYSAIFPANLKEEQALAALRSLCGLLHTVEVVVELVGDEAGVGHLLHVPAGIADSVAGSLMAAMPGLRLEPIEVHTTGPVTIAVRFVAPAMGLLRTDEATYASRSLLAGLTGLRGAERVSLRWALRPGGGAPDSETTEPATSLRGKAQREALRRRQGEPGFSVAGLLLVRAATRPRAKALAAHVLAVIRSRRTIGPSVLVRHGKVSDGRLMPSSFRSRGWLSATETLPLLAWPLGSDVLPGVVVGASRRLPVPRGVPREGRPLFIGFDAYGERPVALSRDAARLHECVIGGTGSGKSVLLAHGILSDLASGVGGVLIDPKSDLVADVLDRVPPELAERVVVLDPSRGGPLPGIDLFADGDPDLRTDVILGALASIYKGAWGPRTEQYLRLGLRSIQALPRHERVLTNWVRLFTDARFRRSVVSRLADPLIRSAWASFEAMTSAEQAQHIAAPMSKVLALLSRPAVRNVISQPSPKLDIGRLLDDGKWLCVALSPGGLGEPAARLLASLIVYATWVAIEARALIPPERRRPATLVVDELQSLESLPYGIEYLFERARGHNCSVVVATQALGRLSETMRRSLLGNVGTLITFRLGYDEAVRIGRELPGLDATRDLQVLPPYEVAARVSLGGGGGVAVMTGRTEPLPSPTGQAERIRRLSTESYGGVAVVPDTESSTTAPDSSGDEFGRKRGTS
jgi:hypothetical protein